MRNVLLLIALALPFASIGAWIDGTGKPIPDKPSMRSTGGFGAQLLLTGSEREFRNTWNSTTGTPKLQTTNASRIGQSISGVILFSGCTPDGGNACLVSVEFSLVSPNGRKASAGNGPVWSKAAPKQRVIMLGEASVTIGFGNDDTPGTYTLVADVTDKIANRSLKLLVPFTVSR
jgi:hypothetical protein